MKLQIDTQQKLIKIEESVNLNELVTFISTLIEDWKDYKLEVTTIINWNNPIIIEHDRWIPQPYIPTTPYPINPYYPIITWIGNSNPTINFDIQ